MKTASKTMTLILGAVVAACGGGGESGQPQATQSDQAAQQAPAPSPAPAQEQPQAGAQPVPAPTPAPPPINAPAPSEQPAPAPPPVSVIDQPAPSPVAPTYTQEQWRIVEAIEQEVASITTHKLTTDGQLPGWLAHFEARKDWPDYKWRTEMRRIAIEDGRRYGWGDSGPRYQFNDDGTWNTSMVCSTRSAEGVDSYRFIVGTLQSDKVLIDGVAMIETTEYGPDQNSAYRKLTYADTQVGAVYLLEVFSGLFGTSSDYAWSYRGQMNRIRYVEQGLSWSCYPG